MNATTGVSIIVPCFNESLAIETFCKTIDEYVAGLPFHVEAVFVDDGSEDNSREKLQHQSWHNIDNVKLIVFSRNFGAHAAIRAGIYHATYDICCWMSMDLQEPLEILPIAYEQIYHGGYDAVYFEKETVEVPLLNRAFSKVYSHLIRKYAVSRYSSDGTATIAFNKKIKDVLNENIEINSSIMLQIIDFGFRYISVPLHYGERIAGKSKWTLSKKIKLFIDSFAAFSFMPIRLVSIMGIIMLFVGFIIGLVTVVNKINNPAVPIGYSSIVSIVAMGFGITNLSLGIIAEYLWRTYDAARKRPPFIVSDIIELADGHFNNK